MESHDARYATSVPTAIPSRLRRCPVRCALGAGAPFRPWFRMQLRRARLFPRSHGAIYPLGPAVSLGEAAMPHPGRVNPTESRGPGPLGDLNWRPAAALCSAVLRSQRCSISAAGKIPPSFMLHSLDSTTSCETHRRRERHWHGNWYDPSPERVRRCQPCPNASVQSRRVVVPAVGEPWEGRWPEDSWTFHISGSGKRPGTGVASRRRRARPSARMAGAITGIDWKPLC